MKEKQIILRLIGGVWHAETFGPDRSLIIELFGTATLPTPWKAGASVDDIILELSGVNPGYVITAESRPVVPSFPEAETAFNPTINPI